MQIIIVYLNYIIIKSFQQLLQIKDNLIRNMLNRLYYNLTKYMNFVSQFLYRYYDF